MVTKGLVQKNTRRLPTKTQSEEEDEVKCTVAQRANDSVILERKRRRLNKDDPNKKSDD